MALAIETHLNGVDLLYGEKGPTARQMLFRDDPSRYKLYGGAVGGGKTWTLCAEGVRLSLAYPGNRGFMCRHESTAFKNTTLATLLKLIDEIERLTNSKIISNHHRTDRIIYFINGSTIMYGSLGDASDFERIKSLEIGWFAIDESSETPFPNYQMLKSRLRWKLPDGSHPPFFGLLASNPEAGWVKDTFVTPSARGEVVHNHAFVPALPSDNPFLPDGYVEDLRSTNPESWVTRYLDGSWDALEGQIWPEFHYKTHVIEPFTIPSNWTKFRAVDHGQVHPTCCLWFAVDGDETLYAYREYYSPGIVSDHCKNINSLSPRNEHYTDTYLPPECWGKTREHEGRLWSIYDEYEEHGIECEKANNEVLGGINRVGEYFKVNPTKPHPFKKSTLGSPSLFIFNTCKGLINEIPEYIWKVSRTAETGKEAPKKIKDDACDALRYGVMSQPSPFREKANETPYKSFNWYMKQSKRSKQQNSFLR